MAPPQCAPRVPSRWDVPKVNTTEDVDLKSNDGDILESATSSFDVSSAALNVVSAKAVIMNPEPVPPSRESGTTAVGDLNLRTILKTFVRNSFLMVVPRLDMKGPVANGHPW